jgi:predicted transcriptional regulator YheO
LLKSRGIKIPKEQVIKDFIHLAKGVAQFFGRNCECVVHDLENLKSTVVAIEGNLTKRKVGSPPTDLLLQAIRGGAPEEGILNYFSKIKDGRGMKSSTFFIHDGKKNIIGSFCLNFDLTQSLVLKKEIEQFCMTQQNPGKREFELKEGEIRETFPKDLQPMIRQIFEEAVMEIGKPLLSLDKEEKLRIVGILEKKGVFMIRGAVPKISSLLGVSRGTIYNYMREMSLSPNNK